MENRNLKFWLTPLFATIIQLVLSAIILFVYEKMYSPKQPDPRAEAVFVIFICVVHGAIETAICYFVSWLYTIKNRNRNMVLVIYGIIYCAISISWAFLLSESRYKNDLIHCIILFMIPTILYLVPYIYGTSRFKKQINISSLLCGTQ